MSETSPERPKRARKKRPPWRVRIARIGQGAGNALEVMRLGRLAPRHGAPYAVVHQERHYRLRHYGDGTGELGRPALLLIPPLMLTAEIYDVAPEVSAVTRLDAAGIDTWIVDFGAPEREEGGMSRTLDDHVRAVADAIGRVREATGRDVHIAGYSQGGMFAYQAAAYLGSKGIASVITFGSPVDIHRSLPNVSTDVAARLVKAARPFVDASLKRVEGLPGVITSTGFKLLSVRKELGQLVDFVRKLHDRQALVKRETRRRFLAGEGFVAWPGPALRKFVDDFIVHNRLMSGGFIIDGRSVTLGDVRCPVLYFVGDRDEFARPAAVRAIARAAPLAETFEVTLHAGHFGLVVGSTANTNTWPTVIQWLRWREEKGTRPALLSNPETVLDEEELENEALGDSVDIELFYDVIVEAIGSAWTKMGVAYLDAGESLDALRYQLPRLMKLRRMEASTVVSCGLSLAEQARAIPERTFFLWKGRAFSYGDADRRVDAVVRGLLAQKIEKGDRVGVLMEGRPSYLSVVTALNRLGAVAVLVSPRLDDATLSRALGLEPLRFLVADPEQSTRARAVFGGDVLVLGGGGAERALLAGVIDMEAIDPAAVALPDWYVPNAGRAADLAMILLTVGDKGEVRAARITNQRWALSAFGAAAACTLTSSDTVYCAMPLHHPAGLLVSVGAALVGGTRLALATRFEASVFWSEVGNYGATVAFYAGEMCRELMNAPSTPAERASSLRLFAGSGLRADVWRRLSARTGVGVLEFYASTEGTLVLANAGGEKIGALGRPLPGSAELALVAYDFETAEIAIDASGHARRVAINEPGLLITRLEPRRPIAPGASARVLRGVFADGDAWLMSSDLLRVDADGDLWFVDRVTDVLRTANGAVPSRPIEDALYELDGVALAVVYGARLPGKNVDVPIAALVLRPGAELDRAALARVIDSLRPEQRPTVVRVVDAIAMTEGYRPLKAGLRGGGGGPQLELEHR